MTPVSKAIVCKVIQRITSDFGVNSKLKAAVVAEGAALATLNAAQVRAMNVAPDIAERSNAVQYPSVSVYCEKVVNGLSEKFRAFSGSAQIGIEVRVSQDRLEGLQEALEIYADAVMQVLNENRGDWGDGMFYCGEYQAAFGPVKHGGKNFVQSGKIIFEIGVSRS